MFTCQFVFFAVLFVSSKGSMLDWTLMYLVLSYDLRMRLIVVVVVVVVV